jgi:adenylylsulfate kinase
VPAESRVSAAERAERLAQKPATLWLTGLAGAGKLTLAAALERRLFDLGASALALDERRYGAERSAAAAFAAAEETARVRRMAEAARLLNEAGLIVICACLSPLTEHRRAAAEIVGPDRFVEIYVAAPPAWCEAHDRSNLYTRARRGELNNVPGIDAPYEKPAAPRLVLSPAELSVTEAVSALVQLLRETGIFPLRGTALT